MNETLPMFPILLPSVPFEERKSLPSESGIYFALSANGDVLYVGATRNLRQRLQNHHRLSRLREMCCMSIAYYSCTKEQLSENETAMIEQFHPVLNCSIPYASYYPPKVKEPITITLTPEAHHIWSTLAEKCGMSRSSFLEVLLRQESEREEQKRTNNKGNHDA